MNTEEITSFVKVAKLQHMTKCGGGTEYLPVRPELQHQKARARVGRAAV